MSQPQKPLTSKSKVVAPPPPPAKAVAPAVEEEEDEDAEPPTLPGADSGEVVTGTQDAMSDVEEEDPSAVLLQKTKQLVKTELSGPEFVTLGHDKWVTLSSVFENVIKPSAIANAAAEKAKGGKGNKDVFSDTLNVHGNLVGGFFVRGYFKRTRAGKELFHKEVCIFFGQEETRSFCTSLAAAVEVWLCSKSADGTTYVYDTFEKRVDALKELIEANSGENLTEQLAAIEEAHASVEALAAAEPTKPYLWKVPLGVVRTAEFVDKDGVQTITEYNEDLELPESITTYKSPSKDDLLKKGKPRRRAVRQAAPMEDGEDEPAALKKRSADELESEDDAVVHEEKRGRKDLTELFKKWGKTHRLLAKVHLSLADVGTDLYDIFTPEAEGEDVGSN